MILPTPDESFHCRSILPCDACRPMGALLVLVGIQLICAEIISPTGIQPRLKLSYPPQTIIY